MLPDILPITILFRMIIQRGYCLGIGLSMSGLLLSGLIVVYLETPSIWILYTTAGFMCGSGFALIELPIMDIIGYYFDK